MGVFWGFGYAMGGEAEGEEEEDDPMSAQMKMRATT